MVEEHQNESLQKFPPQNFMFRGYLISSADLAICGLLDKPFMVHWGWIVVWGFLINIMKYHEYIPENHPLVLGPGEVFIFDGQITIK